MSSKPPATNNIVTLPQADERDIVSQAELRRLYQFEQEAIDAWDKYENFRNSIFMRLKSRSMQAPGKRALRRKYWSRRVVAWRQEYEKKTSHSAAEQILENTTHYQSDKILQTSPARKYLRLHWQDECAVNVAGDERKEEKTE